LKLFLEEIKMLLAPLLINRNDGGLLDWIANDKGIKGQLKD
jgi:hypothetical protein